MNEPNSVTLSAPARGESAPGLARQTAEFLVVLGLCVLVFRTFAAEAYIVPTGSMAPTLLGIHREIACPECGFRFALGVDEEGRAGRPICPNCGADRFEHAAVVECNGDRLLVQKYLFDLRPPQRWEVAVFHSPAEPEQPYVKRVVGLPGESIQIVGGDVYVDGRIARKTLAEQRAMRLLVFDNNFLPRNGPARRRWAPPSALGDDRSAWVARETRFLHNPTSPDAPEAALVDWLEYHHWDPDRAGYGPIRDFYPYNGGDGRSENAVPDLMLEADVAVGTDAPALMVRIVDGSDRYVVRIPVDGHDAPEVRRNGRPAALAGVRGGLVSSSPAEPRFCRVEVSLMDHRLIVALDGVPLFEPLDQDERVPVPEDRGAPLGLGIAGGWAEVRNLRVYRDVYYTGSLANAMHRPFGVEAPYRLGPGEYFVLGDNSPVSNDSRFWPGSPVVRGDLFLGKPFLVHLPSQVVPLQVFGRALYWIPDPREIRYIH